MANYTFKYSPHNVILVSNKESFRTPLVALINNLVSYKRKSYLLSFKKNSNTETVKTLKRANMINNELCYYHNTGHLLKTFRQVPLPRYCSDFER